MIQAIHSYPDGRNSSKGSAGMFCHGTGHRAQVTGQDAGTETAGRGGPVSHRAMTWTSMTPRAYLEAAYQPYGASLVAQMVKTLPAVQETYVRSLGWEDPLEKGKSTHSRILAWRIPLIEEPGGVTAWSLGYLTHNK